jgi:multidrug efflux system membrane fusion protein
METAMKLMSECVILSAVVVIALVAAGCGAKDGQEQGESGIPVRTEAVVREAVSVPIHASGKLVSTTETKLSFKVGGIVGLMAVDEGEAVSEGQLLAALKMDEIDAQVGQARSAYEKAKRDLDRARRLYGDSVATLEQVQDAETGFRLAESARDIAEFNQRYAAIRAPGRGFVLKRFVEAGELVGPGVPVLLFGSSGGTWTVKVGVTDRDVIRLELGDSAAVAFDAYPGETFSADVSGIGEVAGPLSGAYEVELTLTASGRKLVSGFVASVDIYPARCDPMAVVPVEALMEADGENAYVYVPDQSGTTARRLAVKLGCLAGARAAVRSGLEDVDEVITEGAAYLTDGAPIRVVE